VPQSDPTTKRIDVTSPAFGDGQPIPRAYTGEGDDRSPPVRWSDTPQGTRSVAIVCEDPTGTHGTFVHWLAWNIPPDRHALPEGAGAGAHIDGMTHGRNGFGRDGYAGPNPPPGSPHRYRFHVYALDQKLDLAPGAGRPELERAMNGHILGEGEVTGTYAHAG
jgi:Raf kinase inhibitor-like YbhB/YbcL family protein